uniref:Auxin response factor 18 n=3 Tax=Nicotiana TaxID=4085 RepID=A0A1S3XQF5_TOBAC|nr:PREDICTED: auxin response factor 18-like [Nicotiana tabacum]
MQGARHTQYGFSLSDLHLNKMHSSLFPVGFPPLDHAAATPSPSNSTLIPKPSSSDDMSCLLTLGSSTKTVTKSDCDKAPQLVLFGQPIFTEQQISLSSSGDTVSPVCARTSSSDGNADKIGNISDESGSTFDHRGLSELNVEIGHCKVFIESEDVGQTLDLSVLGSYEALCKKLSNMFGIETSEVLNRVLYQDITGAVKQLGDEPFNDFVKTARRLTILTDASSIGARE